MHKCWKLKLPTKIAVIMFFGIISVWHCCIEQGKAHFLKISLHYFCFCSCFSSWGRHQHSRSCFKSQKWSHSLHISVKPLVDWCVRMIFLRKAVIMFRSQLQRKEKLVFVFLHWHRRHIVPFSPLTWHLRKITRKDALLTKLTANKDHSQIF